MTKHANAEKLRFSAKLLFQFRVVNEGRPNVMRLCEERIIVIQAPTARNALALAKRRGKSVMHSYKNDAGSMVHFEFVGIMDLLHLGAECDEDEVWYDIVQRKLPMERAGSILPPENKLNAIREFDLKL
ncbi:DUF4288 domain-containing protein [Rhodanobacter sp. C06]|uniref:DUF4288 domain-containing protein n=1 Tax=Rhodanobacter sp. C06 TaxID=1945854 RepID=UPI00143C51E5|nr:DUF4288 domain-containing protein [Rhodanobacter sp. C06]